MPLRIDIITPERIVFQEEGVDSVTLPGSEGELTILPKHAPLMTELRPGPLTFRRGGAEIDVALSGGFLEVRDDRVVVLADTAERSDEIDIARVEQARQRAQEMLASREDAQDVARAMAALERAVARMKVVERRRRRPGGGQPPQQPPSRGTG
jgi:F-type H+-transporting ATPase subunit epsilon